MEIPGDLRFTDTHEWVRINDDSTITVGISEHAQDQLGELVFVETPEIDREVEAQEGVAVVESVKAASDIYAPFEGQIVEANADLGDSPELINESPYDKGWIYKMKIADTAVVEELMGPEAYQSFADAEA